MILNFYSRVFLADQMNKIYEPLLSLINQEDQKWLERFFNEVNFSNLKL